MILQVEGLQTHFFTAVGTVRAVDGVSYSLDSGETRLPRHSEMVPVRSDQFGDLR